MLGPLRQETEEVAEIRPGLDGEELTAREERREEGIHGAGIVATDEEPVFATDRFATELPAYDL